MGRPTTDPEIRFWQYVQKTASCWLWTGALYQRDGYGQFWDGTKRTRAHRFAYEYFVGSLDDNQVLHRCDNRACVNPEHLFLGTHADNMTDMVKKGRSPRMQGERNGAAKLTETRVKTARYAHHKYGIPQQQIAKRYGVSPAAINFAILGHTWKHV